MIDKLFISAKNVTIRIGESLILKNVSWEMQRNEHWAIIGPNGSGKSTFVKAFLGKVQVVEGNLTCYFKDDEGKPAATCVDCVGYVAPELLRTIMGREILKEEAWHYCGQIDKGTTVEDIIAESICGNLREKDLGKRIEEVALKANVKDLLKRKIRSLSTGQMNQVMIARALIKKPKLLILDEPFDGLDKASKSSLSETIQNLMQGEMKVILITQKVDEILPGITNLLYIKDGCFHRSGKIRDVLKKEIINEVFEIDNSLKISKYAIEVKRNQESAFLKSKEGFLKNKSIDITKTNQVIVEMNNVSVKYGNEEAIKDFNWTIRKGENWVLLGPDGAGKTTIINLINGENPKVYANDIRLFGIKRGSGESIWETRRNLSFVSANMQNRFNRKMLAKEVVMSGFYDTDGLYKKCTVEEKEVALKWMNELGIYDLKDRYFGRLSYGQRQIVLITRALVKSPLLLLLDEPLNGLDAAKRKSLSEILEFIGYENKINLLYATNNEDEILNCMTHQLSISYGRVTGTKILGKNLSYFSFIPDRDETSFQSFL